MPDLETLEPDVRCYAMVGLFLSDWALMEGQINEAIEKALGLDVLQSAAVCSNMMLRDKIHMLRTIVSLSPIVPEERAKKFDKLLEGIATMLTERNMVAHNTFGPSDDKEGVTFYVTKAKGKLSFPNTTWRRADLQQKRKAIAGFYQALRELQEVLSVVSILRPAVGFASGTSTAVAHGQAYSGLLNLPHQESFDPTEPIDQPPPEPEA